MLLIELVGWVFVARKLAIVRGQLGRDESAEVCEGWFGEWEMGGVKNAKDGERSRVLWGRKSTENAERRKGFVLGEINYMAALAV